jgi:hypothetical protein
MRRHPGRIDVIKKRKLSLSRETIRELTADQSRQVVGGGILTTNVCHQLSLDEVQSGCCVISRGPGICATLAPCVTTGISTVQ